MVGLFLWILRSSNLSQRNKKWLVKNMRGPDVVLVIKSQFGDRKNAQRSGQNFFTVIRDIFNLDFLKHAEAQFKAVPLILQL